MEKSSFFNSVSGDRLYESSDFASYFHKFLTNGVYPTPSTSLQVVSSENYQVLVKAGAALINGYMYQNTEDLLIQIEASDGVLNRTDMIVVRLDLVSREIRTVYKKGTPATSPIAPILIRDATVHELALATVNITKSTTNISQSAITDTRMDSARCGWVNSTIQVDTETLFEQYKDWFETTTTMATQEWEEWMANARTWIEDIRDQLANDDHTQINERIEDIHQGVINLSDNFDLYKEQVEIGETQGKRFAQSAILKNAVTLSTGTTYALINYGNQAKKNWNPNNGSYVFPVDGLYEVHTHVLVSGIPAGTTTLYLRFQTNVDEYAVNQGIAYLSYKRSNLDTMTIEGKKMLYAKAGQSVQALLASSLGGNVPAGAWTYMTVTLIERDATEDEIPGTIITGA